MNQLNGNYRGFNARLSGLRIIIAHTIGILKARFASLRSLPHRQIWTSRRMNWCLAWIGSCVVLHNLLLDHDNWEPTQEELDEVLREIREEEEDRDQGVDGPGAGAGPLELGADLGNADHRQALFQKYLQSEWAPANRRHQ